MKKRNSIGESRKARFDTPVRYPALWRLLAWPLKGPAQRLHNYRQLSVRMLEDTLDDLNDRNCHE